MILNIFTIQSKNPIGTVEFNDLNEVSIDCEDKNASKTILEATSIEKYNAFIAKNVKDDIIEDKKLISNKSKIYPIAIQNIINKTDNKYYLLVKE